MVPSHGSSKGDVNNLQELPKHQAVNTLTDSSEEEDEIRPVPGRKKVHVITSDTESDDEPLVKIKRKERKVMKRNISELLKNIKVQYRPSKTKTNVEEKTPEGSTSDNENGSTLTEVPAKKTNNDTERQVPKRSRKRKRSVGKWKKVNAKHARNAGEAHISIKGKEIPARTMGAGCRVNCRYKCLEKITEDQRKEIFAQYYDLPDVNRKRDFIAQMVLNKKKQRFTTEQKSRRNFSYQWHLEINGEKIRVCKTMFLSTISIGGTVVDTALKKKNKESGIVMDDQRGKHMNRHNKLPCAVRKNIRKHLNSFPRVESHYLREQTHREYLEEGLTIAKMYNLYKDWCEQRNFQAGKKWLYTDIFNTEFNLGFFKPKKDQCDVCEQYLNASDQEKAELQEKFEEHHKNKELSRAQKDLDKDRCCKENTFVCACYDLQKVLPVPKSEVSPMYYKRKLAVYNFTIFNMGNKQGECFMWYEGIAQRGSNEVATSVNMFLEQKARDGVKEVVFYSDNCAGQNKNTIIATMYAKVVATTDIEKITHNFLEKGHTQNEGDCMHSTIEKAIGKTPVFSPQQYYILARSAKKTGNPYTVHELATDDILDFHLIAQKTIHSVKLDDEKEKVQWNMMRVFEVRKDSPNKFYFKYQYEEEEFKCMTYGGPSRRKKPVELSAMTIPPAYNGPRPISSKKFADLVKLCDIGAIPKVYHAFFQNLNHDE